MNKFYQVSTPWINKLEKKNVNLALKNNEISGFLENIFLNLKGNFRIFVNLSMQYQ